MGKLIYPNGEEEIVVGLQKDGKWKDGSGQVFYFLPEGTIALLRAPSGGGYGNPLDREPEMALKDVLDGYVSIEAAKKDYGVIINQETLNIDYESTNKLRKELKSVREPSGNLEKFKSSTLE